MLGRIRRRIDYEDRDNELEGNSPFDHLQKVNQ